MIKQFLKRYKAELILVLIGLIWICVFSFLLQLNYQTYKFPDTYSYIVSIKQLYYDFILNDHRPFLFSFLNGIPFFFHAPSETIFKWSLFLNLFSWLGTIVFLYKILSQICKNNIAFIFSMLYITLAGSLAICFHLLTEPIFTFFLIFIMYCFQKYEHSKNIKFLALAISILILSLVIKPLLKFFIVLVLLFYFKKLLLVLKSKYVIAIIFSISLVFFQMFSLKKTYGHFTLSYIDVVTYYNYLGTKAENYKTNQEFNQDNNSRKEYFSKLDYRDLKKVALEDLKKQLKSNKLNVVKAYFSNLYINSTKGSASVFGCVNNKKTNYFDAVLLFFKGISKIQNIILTCFGFLLSIFVLLKWNKNSNFIKIIAFAFLYIVLISAISCDQGDRFHIVFYPIVLILIANYRKTRLKPFAAPLQK